MNFCVTDGDSVIATRYISSRKDEAASLVCFSLFKFHLAQCSMAYSGTLRERSLVNTPKVVITRCPKQTSERTLLWYCFSTLDLSRLS